MPRPYCSAILDHLGLVAGMFDSLDIDAEHLNDEALGRALETFDTAGVTARYRFMAATAAERLGLAPCLAPRDPPRFPGDGRENREEDPGEHVIQITRGDSREHRPDRNKGCER
jgi:hypothetical protein